MLSNLACNFLLSFWFKSSLHWSFSCFLCRKSERARNILAPPFSMRRAGIGSQNTNSLASSLVLADSCLKFRFSFTRGSYKSFLLRHGSFSYVIYFVKSGGRKVYPFFIYCVESGRFLNSNFLNPKRTEKLSHFLFTV